MSKVIVVTGSSTGVGLHTALKLAEEGHIVYATMRNLDKKEQLEKLAAERDLAVNLLHLDVQDHESVQSCVNTIIEKENRLDVLVNNAGAGFLRTLEQAEMNEIYQVMDVNFFGPIRCIKAVLPQMRSQQSGHIINISSVGGLVGQPMNEIYCAAKFALEGLTESIATYMQPYFNIKVTLLEPGGIITEFGNNLMRYIDSTGGFREDAYSPLLADYMEYRKSWTDEVKAKVFQTPETIAGIIATTIADEHPPLRILTSNWAKEFSSLKTSADPDGNNLQQEIRRKILNKG